MAPKPIDRSDRESRSKDGKKPIKNYSGMDEDTKDEESEQTPKAAPKKTTQKQPSVTLELTPEHKVFMNKIGMKEEDINKRESQLQSLRGGTGLKGNNVDLANPEIASHAQVLLELLKEVQVRSDKLEIYVNMLNGTKNKQWESKPNQLPPWSKKGFVAKSKPIGDNVFARIAILLHVLDKEDTYIKSVMKPEASKVVNKPTIDRHIALMPFGYDDDEQGVFTDKHREDLEAFKTSPSQWEERLGKLPSFEVWCQITQYDPDSEASDGGPKFQHMMQLMLAYGTGMGDINFSESYEKDDWVQPDSGFSQYHSMYGGVSSTTEEQAHLHVPKSAGLKGDRHFGAHVGHRSNQNNESLQQFGNVQSNALEEVVVNAIGSKMNWAHSWGLTLTNMVSTGKHSSEASQVSNGYLANCTEVDGTCILLLNKFAAIFGLYYYPGCQSPDLNWIVEQVVDGVTFSIRMRMYNPKYKRDRKRLKVFEEVNPQASMGQEAPFIGGTKGVTVPECFAEPRTELHFANGQVPTRNAYPQSPANLILGSTGHSRISPLLKLYAKDNVASQRVEKWENEFPNLHTPTNLLSFGWNVPASLYLYPHLKLPDDNLRVVEEGEQTENSRRAGYQPWPKLQSGYASLFEDSKDAPRWTAIFNFGKGWDSLDPEVRRQHALGLPIKESAQNMAFEMDAEENAAEELEDDEPLGDGDDPTPNPDVAGGEEGTEGTVSDTAASTEAGSLEETLQTPELDLLNDDKNPVDIKTSWKSVTGETTLPKEACQPGAAKRLSEKNPDLNDHFKAARFHPWPHYDVYEQPRMKFKPGEVMNEEALEEYKRKYGSDFNLYLRGEQIAKSIGTIEPQYGEIKEGVVTRKIGEDEPLFRKNMCKILAIFYDPNPMGTFRHEITFKQKQDGMLGGVWALRDACDDGTVLKEISNPQGIQLVYGEPKKEKEKYICVCRPVFNKKPPKPKNFTFTQARGVDEQIATYTACLDDDEWNGWENRSDMSVLEWICSPWHYAYLPYQPMSMLFKDGETYSEGCLRCCRPFYEYEKLYMSYKHTPEKLRNWQYKFWRPDADGKGNKCGIGIAPVPFHDERLWSKDEVRPILQGKILQAEHEIKETAPMASSEVPLKIEYEYGGWHQWKTFAFLIGNSTLLNSEFSTLTSNKSVFDKGGIFEGIFANKTKPQLVAKGDKINRITYKQYQNHIYSDDRVDVFTSIVDTIKANMAPKWKDKTWLHYLDEDYLKIPECRLELVKNLGAMKYGQRKMALMRGSKYGNLCRDCCSLLTMAPGLLQRNSRVATSANEILKRDTSRTRKTDWWMRLQSEMNLPSSLMRFDPMILHVKGNKQMFTGRDNRRNMSKQQKADYMSKFENSMKIYADAIKKHHFVGTTLGKKTKFTESPEIYIQRSNFFPFDSSRPGELDSEITERAIKMIQDALETRDSSHLKFDNVSLQYLLRDLVQKYVHETKFTHDEPKIIDQEALRMEIRNAHWTGKKWILGKGLKAIQDSLEIKGPPEPYKNCLITRVTTFDKHGNPKYEDKAYYCTMENRQTVKTSPDYPTMWQGDRFVMDWDGNEFVHSERTADNNKIIQWRKLQQSNIFITYSLHRAVKDEIEARQILEKMAGACHELFGNDQNLSELLVFGQKLGGFTNKEDQLTSQDTISTQRLVTISEPNKKDAQDKFYGYKGRSSYVFDTYETHIHKVSVDGGMEIGPNRHHPHFHVLLTVNHWGYAHIDYFKMNAYLEMMFKGIDPFGDETGRWGDKYFLQDASGGNFYTDAEMPYVKIKLYPQDNWQDVLNAYVRKNAMPTIFEALKNKYTSGNLSVADQVHLNSVRRRSSS